MERTEVERAAGAEGAERRAEDRRPKRRPWVTIGLIGANLAVALVARIPGLPDEDAVARALGQDRVAVFEGEYWRILTGPFAHAGAAHLAMNLIGLAILGKILERGLGHARFASLYALSAISGALSFQVFSSGDLGLGASGAVYGAFGFLLAARSATRRPGGRRRLAAFLLWTAVVFGLDQAVAVSANFLSGVQIASSAHFGGFAAGALLAAAWLPAFAPAAAPPRAAVVLARAGSVAMPIGLAAAALLFPPRGVDRQAYAFRRELERRLAGKDFQGAAEAWKKISARDPLERLTFGYIIFDGLMAEGRRDLAQSLLDELIRMGLAALDAAPADARELPDLQNTVAWLCALAEGDEHLARARRLAESAVASVRFPARGPWRFLASVLRHRAGAYLNTRAWIDFRLASEQGFGDLSSALRDLETAADLSPSGPQYLYLAWAYYRTGRIVEAREAVGRAREAGDLSPYETVLLEELEASLR